MDGLGDTENKEETRENGESSDEEFKQFKRKLKLHSPVPQAQDSMRPGSPSKGQKKRGRKKKLTMSTLSALLSEGPAVVEPEVRMPSSGFRRKKGGGGARIWAKMKAREEENQKRNYESYRNGYED